MCWWGRCRPRSFAARWSCPRGAVGLQVEPELADALVDDVEGEPGALPLLSTALLELWLKRKDNTLTAAAYRESGGVHGAVARLAENTYERVKEEHRPLVRAIMLRLVGDGDGEAVVATPRASRGDSTSSATRAPPACSRALADSRLVDGVEGSVEVAHEALLREWPRLREWIEEDGQGRRLRRHLTQAADEWDAGGREDRRALSRRPSRGRARLEQRPRARAERAGARLRHREPRGLRDGDHGAPSAPTEGCAAS